MYQEPARELSARYGAYDIVVAGGGIAGISAALAASRAGKRVLLVDDVYTTGATARECAKALREAGAASVSLLVYAKGGK